MNTDHSIHINPLSSIGGQVFNDIDVSKLSEQAFAELASFLFQYRVLVIKNQHDLTPRQLADFTARFNHGVSSITSAQDRERVHIWRDLEHNPWEQKKSEIGHAGDYMIPDVPEVLVIGQGDIENHFGITGQLGGKRQNYGLSEENTQVVGGQRFQWHLDGAFYQTHPPAITALHCVEAPKKQTISCQIGGLDFEYGKGSTGYFCGIQAYQNLSKQEKDLAASLIVHYGPRPFERVLGLEMDELGLSVQDDGRDYQRYFDEMVEDKGCVSYPLLWTHPVTKQTALMAHTRCLFYLETDQGETFSITESRNIIAKLIQKSILPETTLFVEYETGDLVLWDNLGVWHTATGGLDINDRRIVHLCSYNGSQAPAYQPK